GDPIVAIARVVLDAAGVDRSPARIDQLHAIELAAWIGCIEPQQERCLQATATSSELRPNLVEVAAAVVGDAARTVEFAEGIIERPLDLERLGIADQNALCPVAFVENELLAHQFNPKTVGRRRACAATDKRAIGVE